MTSSYWNITKQAALNIGLFNLTDEKYTLWSDLQGIGGGTAALPSATTMDRFSQPGRNVRVSFKYQF